MNGYNDEKRINRMKREEEWGDDYIYNTEEMAQTRIEGFGAGTVFGIILGIIGTCCLIMILL